MEKRYDNWFTEYNARQCTHHTNISNRIPDSVMVRKGGKPIFHSSYHVTAIKFLLVGIIITTGTLSVLRPVSLNQNHTAMAQQQQLHISSLMVILFR